ncbi:hypothetical protein, putative [Plasmodium sp.]|nr:hypothetical protein, putative [Plasmodium sp.]
MISYNFKLSIFSIILGTLSLIYNNDSNGLYENIYYTNVVLVTTNFRTLAELLYEPTTNHRNENNKLKEFTKTNETKCSKNIYSKDDKKPNEQIQQVPENENIGIPKTVKYRKGTHSKEKDAISNRSSRSLKYLEMQRKLYNNFYVRPEIYFQNLQDESNNKSCECSKNTTSDKLSSSNNVHDKYLDNLENVFARTAGVFVVSATATNVAGAKVACAKGVATAVNAAVNAKLAVVYGAADAGSRVTAAALEATSKLSAFWGPFSPYGIAALVLIIIAVAFIILYIYLRRTRKNSLKPEFKKYLCT